MLAVVAVETSKAYLVAVQRGVICWSRIAFRGAIAPSHLFPDELYCHSGSWGRRSLTLSLLHPLGVSSLIPLHRVISAPLENSTVHFDQPLFLKDGH